MAETGSEKALRRNLRRNLEAEDPRAQVRQIENSAMSGEPDTYLCSRGHSVWVEAKHEPARKRTTTVIKCRHVRNSQLRWARAHQKAGGLVWFLLQVGAGARGEYFLLSPRQALTLREQGYTMAQLREVSHAHWRGSLSPVLDTLLQDRSVE